MHGDRKQVLRARMTYVSIIILRKVYNNQMKTYGYDTIDPQSSDQWLSKVMVECFQVNDIWDNDTTIVNLIDHPCGFGKTSHLIRTINCEPTKRFLIIVPTLSEVERILAETDSDRFQTPSSDNGTKADDLERLIHSGVSIVTTHKLFNESVNIAIEGGLKYFHVVVDEVPDVILKARTVSKEAFEKLYLDTGYCTVGHDGLIRTTDKGREELPTLRGVINDKLANEILTDRMIYAGGSALISALSMHLFQGSLSVTVLTFMSEGSIFLRYLERSKVTFNRYINDAAHEIFRANAKRLVQIETIGELEKIPFNYSNQTKYSAKSKEAKSVSIALKNLKQRHFKGVYDGDILITCAKEQWYTKHNKPAAFSSGSRMFSKVNWIPNTTRGTNEYDHCTHLIYLYDQHANPTILRWLAIADRKFQDQYALTELIQWLWRSRIRKGASVTLYLPSKRMRDIFNKWIES
jgi:hypothetical protein